MAYADQQMSGSKIFSIILVGIIHVLVGYALVSGLAYDAVKKAAIKLEVIDVEEEKPEEPEEPPPPPPEQEQQIQPPPVVSPPPIVRTPVVNPPISSVRNPPKIFQPTEIAPPKLPPPSLPKPEPKVSKARGASPKGRNRWAARVQDSYPSRAQREGREGTVTVRLRVGPDGRPSSCDIARTSGHGDLDDAACKAIMRVARFEPALDDDGNPTSDTWQGGFKFEIPDR